MTYHLSDEDLISCDDSCESRRLNCAVEFHGYTDKNVFRIVESLLGEQVKSFRESSDLYKVVGPKVDKVGKTCRKWKAIPPRINCGKKKFHKNISILCPCVTGKKPVFSFYCTKMVLLKLGFCCTKVKPNF